MSNDTNNSCVKDLVRVDFGNIDINMEVKSEHSEVDENNFHDNCIDYDLEFIIPEKRRPECIDGESVYLVANESFNSSQNNVDALDSSYYDTTEDIQDEPEVEIDEVTVRQELVEVALDPSLLLFVNKDSRSITHETAASSMEKCQIIENERINEIVPQKENNSSSELLTVSLNRSTDSLFSITSSLNVKKHGNSVTAALRQVKRKPFRAHTEPLNEIKCPSDNVSNAQIIDDKNTRVDKITECNNVNEENDIEDCNEAFCGSPTPDSDSEFKEQTPITKRTIRHRKRNASIGKLLGKRSRKKKLRNVIQAIKLKYKPGNLKRRVRVDKSIRTTNPKAKPVLIQNESSSCGTNDNVNVIVGSETDYKSNSSVVKTKRNKRDKTKPSIFDEVQMDYTILNEHESTEKSKRIRKRDKKSKDAPVEEKPESFDCNICDRKFREKSHLATHARAHIDVRNFKCNKCGNLFKTKTNLFFHMKTHSDTPFKCDKCNKIYQERRTLMRHIRVVHSSQNTFACDQCGKQFKSMNNLNLHYTLHTGIKPFTCAVCSRSFVYKSTYVSHMKGHNADDSFTCELCPTTNSNKSEFRRLCNHHSESRPWLCTVCGKGYPLKGTLKNHMKTHEPEKPYKCSECPKSFMKKQSLECHLKKHAGEGPQFMCDQCSQSYFNVFALKRHYLKHTSERKFVCEVCSKAFWMKDALKVHMRTHTNIKLFTCLQCPKSFAHKHTLDAHLRTHLDVEPYSCSVCQKSFVHKYNLTRHERQQACSSVLTAPLVIPSIRKPVSIMVLPAISASPTMTLHNYSVNPPCFINMDESQIA